MRPTQLDVLYEDNHLLVLNKPSDLPTMGVEANRSSLIDAAKRYVKQRYSKPGNVYLGVVSRLDSLVSGVVVFARTSKAAARLTEQFRSRRVEKTYWAIVEGAVPSGEQRCVDWIAKDERAQRMRVVDPAAAGAQEAKLTYRTVRSVQGGTLVEIELETGRKHQIRVQLAARGHAILGDRKYGARTAFPAGIALHARRLRLEHPVRREPLEAVAPVPKSWRMLGVE